MIKGYIFDLDGTLLDSLNVWDNVGNRYLQSIGIQGPDDLDSLMEHMSLQEAALYMKNTFVLTQSVNEVALGITYIIEEAYEKSIPLKIGARKVIEKCFDKNYQIVAFTAGSVELATKALMRLNLFHYFQNIYSCQTCGYNKTEIE
ncbi:MAG: HAD family hydrolase, partial [Coprobacillus cateniformis]